MKKIVLNRWFLGTLGIVLLALVLWFLGPYFAFGEVRPFASVLGRVIAIAVLFIIWIGILQWQYLRAVRASRKLASEVAAQQEAPAIDQTKAAEPADAAQLRQRFEDAVAKLRKDRKSGGGLYSLPWYVIIGPPGSGKTTALVNSGLRFPMEQEVGKRAIRGVGGTRNCDWWFTDEAILLDTAGRYTTQDSDRIADGAGWGQFLQLLKRHRRRQPINGVLVAYSASDLLTRSDQELDGDIVAIKQRLEELNRHLGISLPVYLLITKADLVSGFREYFDDLDAAGRSQVWGVTFPLEDSQSGRALGELPAEVDALVERLNRGVFGRLEQERDLRRRSTLFAFPQQFASLRPRLLQLVNDVFGGTAFDKRLFLRGVYFTSGTQEGTPIDRLLGSMSRALGLAEPRQVQDDKGRAYFIERLLKEVVLQESGLAGSDRRAAARKAGLQFAAYALVLVLVLAGLAALATSYRKNVAYLGQVQEAVDRLEETPVPEGSSGAESLSEWLPRLDALRGLVDVAGRGGADVPMSMRVGLYQGRAVGNAAREAYGRELNSVLVPQLAQAFAAKMSGLAADPDKLYEYLKAYLMLGEPKRLEPGQLGFLAGLEWSRAYRDRPDARNRLAEHLNWLLEDGRLSPITLDDALVSRARNLLRAATPASLAYSRLKLLFADDKYKPIRFDQEVQGIETVFRRRSGRSLAEPFPAIYTKPVFEEISSAGTAEIAKRLQEDSWVFGPGESVQDDSGALMYEVLALYEFDYIDAWDELLADLERAPLGDDPQEASRMLGILGSPGSPLKVLLAIVSDNTMLTKPEQPDAAAAAADALAEKGLAKAKQSSLGRMMMGDEGGPSSELPAPGDLVTEHFADLHRLLEGPPGQAPIDRTIALLGQMSQCIGRMGEAVGTASAAQSLTSGGCSDLARALEVEAGQLPAGAAAVVGSLAGETQAVVRQQARGELADLYRSQVVAECSAIIDGRYPFTRGAASDVPIADFARLFGTGGVFDGFFQTHLAPFVDTSGTRWRWREASGGSLGLSNSILAQFQAVNAIRQQFFRPGGAEPELRFSLTPEYLDATSRRLVLEINGQRMEYSHGPQSRWPVKWPSEVNEQVVVTFDTGSGPGPSKVYDGPWAVFRFFDDATLNPQTETRFSLAVAAGGQNARLLLDASSIRNPFAAPVLSSFRCGG